MTQIESNQAESTRARMSRGRLAAWATLLVLVGVAAPRLAKENLLSEGGVVAEHPPLPEFPVSSGLDDSRWLGTEPLTVASMLGRVWVLKVWTFGCITLRALDPLCQRVE